MVIRLKYGVPTEMRSSFRASTTSGKIVPTRITKANAPNSTLLARKAPSREMGESMRPGDRSRSPRHPISAIVVSTISEKNTINAGPMLDSVKACTDSSTPERVMNVPRMVSANVAHSSEMFQTRSMPRRSCTITECR